MDKSQVAEINISQVNDDSIRKLRGEPAFVKVNRRIRALLIPIDVESKEEALAILNDMTKDIPHQRG